MSNPRDTLPATKEEKEAALKEKLKNSVGPRLKKVDPHRQFKTDASGQRLNDTEKQGNEFWDKEVQPHLANSHSPKKVAILYAANNDQADKLIGGQVAKAIRGGGQAELFEYLLDKKIAGKHENDVHILPIGTSQSGDQDGVNNHATIESMNKQLAYITWHIANGWEVIGFPRAVKDENGKFIGTEFSLGGGFSKEWMKADKIFIAEKDGKYELYTHPPKNSQAFKDQGYSILSQNQYAQRHLEMLSKEPPEKWPEFLQNAALAPDPKTAAERANNLPTRKELSLEELLAELERGAPSKIPTTPTKEEPSKPAASPTAGDPTSPLVSDDAISQLLDEMDKANAIIPPVPAPAEPAPTPKTVAPAAAVSVTPSSPHAGGKITASTETTYKREMMVNAKDAFEKVFQTPTQPYTGWKLEERVKDAKGTYFSVTDKANKERFTIHPAEIKTTEDNIDTFKAMLECYKAANPPGKIPTITAYSEEGKKLWQQAVIEVYTKELTAGAKIEVNIASTTTPAPPKATAPVTATAPPTEETHTRKI